MRSVGFDLVEVGRISRSLENPRFLNRVFSPAEREAYAGRGRPARSYAAAFAAKEAFAKAVGTGFRGFSLTDVELLHDRLGAPFLRLNGGAMHIAGEKRLKFSVSLTHTETVAGAVVIAFSDDESNR